MSSWHWGQKMVGISTILATGYILRFTSDDLLQPILARFDEGDIGLERAIEQHFANVLDPGRNICRHLALQVMVGRQPDLAVDVPALERAVGDLLDLVGYALIDHLYRAG